LLLIEPAPYEAQLQQAQGNLAADQAQRALAVPEYQRKFVLSHNNQLAATQEQVD
jgi:multidrug efflux pump subunit AcrA (membrane-fusion protein)